jgi:hypothetical protein
MCTEEEKRQVITELVEDLGKLSFGELMKAQGFVLGLQANQGAA